MDQSGATRSFAREAHRLLVEAAMMRRIRNLLAMAMGPLRERGLVETIRSVGSCLRASRRERLDSFDEFWGTDTEHHIGAAELDCSGADVPGLWRYWPTARATFERILESADVAYESSVFVDLGSGKGRVLLMASEYPFRRIVGVELSPALHRVAERNVAAWRSPYRRCPRIDLVCMDAAQFQLPPEETLLYLFQPFPANTMRAVLDNLGKSLQRHPRPVRLAYLNPLHHPLLMSSGLFALERWGHSAVPGEFDWAIYRASGWASGYEVARP